VTAEQFITYLEHPELLNEESVGYLGEMIDEHPYFPAARILYLRNLKNIDSYKFDAELQKHAVFIPDRKVLYSFINHIGFGKTISGEIDASVYIEKSRLSNDDDALSKTISHNSAIFDVEKEYGEVQIETKETKETNLIDRFIMTNPTLIPNEKPVMKASSKKRTEKNPLDEGLITQTLADIYEKQGLYYEALNAYEKLSLKFPEKNSYFASRIEKIKNLISKDS
jgi:hypothetical protein